MEIIETPLFTKLIGELLSDDEYRELQQALAVFPEAGDLLEGGHGLRKLRWGLRNSGKTGGLRIIYFWQPTSNDSSSSPPTERAGRKT